MTDSILKFESKYEVKMLIDDLEREREMLEEEVDSEHLKNDQTTNELFKWDLLHVRRLLKELYALYLMGERRND